MVTTILLFGTLHPGEREYVAQRFLCAFLKARLADGTTIPGC